MNKLRIHFLVPAADGPIVSEPSGHPVQITRGGKFVVACDPAITLNELNRGTGEPWGVRCAACVATEIFQQLRRPKPGLGVPDTTEIVDNGCC